MRTAPRWLAVDTQGYLWNARYGGARLVRVASSGEVDRVTLLPVANPTACTFGGHDLKTLYISARSADRLSAGSLFALKTDTGGLPRFRFKLSQRPRLLLPTNPIPEPIAR